MVHDFCSVVIKTRKQSTCPTVRTKKGVKKLNERLDNTTNDLYHASVTIE